MGLGVVACVLFVGCSEPTLVLGELSCGEGDGGASSVDDDGLLAAPWQTSFEDGFCGYKRGTGFCYYEGAGYRLVTSPVRTGPFAAAFELDMDTDSSQHQARCVRKGTLPEAAIYSAWFYIPSGASDPENWNLVHFQGGEPDQLGPFSQGTWDVTVGQSSTGELSLYVADLSENVRHSQRVPVPLPTDRWFHLEFYLKRSAEATGEVALFQDGEELIRVADVVTDRNTVTEWYVGNYARSLKPSKSTLYVDDVSVRPQP